MKLKTAFLTLLLSLLFIVPVSASPSNYIYDYAGVLTAEEVTELELLAQQLSDQTNTSLIVLTTNDTGGLYIKDYMANFFDNNKLGYNEPNGNTAILSLDLNNRDIYLAGFHKAKEHLDSTRIDKILDKATPYITDGEYLNGFKVYMEEATYYLELKPGYNPDSVFHKIWFQLLVSVFVGALIVGLMVASRGGKVTVNHTTYADSEQSGVVSSDDRYVTTHITKIKKPSNNGKGGGTTGGGTSFSGGGRKF